MAVTALGQFVKDWLGQHGKSQGWLAQQTGLTASAISRIINKERKPKPETMVNLAAVTGADINMLYQLAGYEEDVVPAQPPQRYRNVPILGRIACGEPILAMEEVGEYLTLPEDILPAGDIIALRMQGESMERARLHDGDLALIRMQDTIEDGEIAAVCVGENSEEATIKRVRFVDDYVTLLPQSDDPQYRALTYRAEQVRVVGKVAGVWWG